MYTAPRLIQLLAQQHQQRSPELFKQDTFTLRWRGKIGSFPYPDLETIVSAGEPCGRWNWSDQDFGQLQQRRSKLPLNGYIPASAIRGVVRAWASKREDLRDRMRELLGEQGEDDNVVSGRIQFLDAWTETFTQLTLDIVNPQQQFQVFHNSNEQGKPLPFYTLGDGDRPLQFTVAIRGIPNQATVADVEEVWNWVQQALSLYGVGGRTASGYGAVKAPRSFKPSPELRKQDPGCSTCLFEFTLYSQGSYGADTGTPELRPSHWRGWLRSWLLRFFLGVMTPDHAQITVGELMGTIDSPDDHASRKGVVRLQVIPGSTWGEQSDNQPVFYAWKGRLSITAPSEILNEIILPVIRIAVMVGGLGRGWRRPLHIFVMNNGRAAARGSYLKLMRQVTSKETLEKTMKPFGVALKPDEWTKLYQTWKGSVQQRWANRFTPGQTNLRAEVFSPLTCSVYVVPEPIEEPIDWQDLEWQIKEPRQTRGQGMKLIYEPRYKRQPDVGGNAAGGGNAHCSWVSIKRVKAGKQAETGCQEVVCLFAGEPNQLRSQFLQELNGLPGSTHLFGLTPN